MSGRTKRIIYDIVSSVALLLAAAGVVLLAYFGARSSHDKAVYTLGVLLCFVFCLMFVPLHTVLHELGHVLGGLVCGMRVVSLSFGIYDLNWRGKFTVTVRNRRDANGAAALLPRREGGARTKLAVALYAGAALDLIYAAVMFALYFAVTQHPAMLFFTLFAPLCLYEGLLALYPVELPAGPTDGKFALDLIKKTPDAEVALRVMTAQGILYEKDYGDLPRGLLFGAPTVREDSVAYLALLQLQWRYLYCRGEDCAPQLMRLRELYEYLPGGDRAEVASDLLFAEKVLGLAGEEGKNRREELSGKSACVLRGLAVSEPTEENIARARKAAEEERMLGERKFELRLLDELKK